MTRSKTVELPKIGTKTSSSTSPTTHKGVTRRKTNRGDQQHQQQGQVALHGSPLLNRVAVALPLLPPLPTFDSSQSIDQAKQHHAGGNQTCTTTQYISKIWRYLRLHAMYLSCMLYICFKIAPLDDPE
jgi:hypothetical protein